MEGIIVEDSRKLIDNYGRRIRKLRVSLLDACNFRCFYCMPEDVKFKSHKDWLSTQEILNISSLMVNYGVEQIRLTGGEPLMRKGFRDIVTGLSELPLQKLGFTTNGFYLDRELDFLKDTNCQHINISLDSLNEDKFNVIARKKSFYKVYPAILKAANMGFKVKVNTVLLKGINDKEILDFVKFSADNNIEVRFLEVMKIGQAYGKSDDLHMPASRALSLIRSTQEMKPVLTEADSTSFNYKTDTGAHIGFIASETRPFCNSCSRWRLSAEGFLRACLMSEEGLSLKNKNKEECDDIFRQVLKMKPIERIASIGQNMNQIGG